MKKERDRIAIIGLSTLVGKAPRGSSCICARFHTIDRSQPDINTKNQVPRIICLLSVTPWAQGLANYVFVACLLLSSFLGYSICSSMLWIVGVDVECCCCSCSCSCSCSFFVFVFVLVVLVLLGVDVVAEGHDAFLLVSVLLLLLLLLL